MPSYAHKKIIEKIVRIDDVPSDSSAFGEWIKAGQHLDFLQADAASNEIVIYGSSQYTFITSMVVSNERLSPIDQDDLLRWNGGVTENIAAYAYGGSHPDMWIERGGSWGTGAKALEGAMSLVFARTFEGWSGDDRNYYEVHQEYAHLSGIHWRPEHRSYGRFDENGDLEHVVGITARGGKHSDVTLVSFMWEPLEEYLAVSNSSLVRMFDFTLLRRESFNGLPDGPEATANISDECFYRQRILEGSAAYTRGVQILSPRRTPASVMQDIKDGWSHRKKWQYVSFIAHDWRNKRLCEISTDPAATTNYFEATENDLPFELSPAFFRPEVLSKYRTDREKYEIGERDVRCRASWYLKGYDVNDAGQVHAYICDLRRLPYAEQLHWRSFNEEPKAGISERAITNDFKGEFVSFTHPLRELLDIMRRWNEEHKPWWKLRDPMLLQRASVPLTSSRDEWADSFMDLSQLVVEGFQLKFIRTKLQEIGTSYTDEEQSILLLERYCQKKQTAPTPDGFLGLRTIQKIRSKVKGHAGSSEAKQIVNDAISDHGSFRNHFTHVCDMAVTELKAIEAAM